MNIDKEEIYHALISHNMPQYILGRNIYSEAVVKHYDFDGVDDDFTAETQWNNLPIIQISDIPKDARILNCSDGKTQTIQKKLSQKNIKNIDYFYFRKKSQNSNLPEIYFCENFSSEYKKNNHEFQWLAEQLDDAESKRVLEKLCAFKDSYDMTHLDGFKDLEDKQYFEDFLEFDAADTHFLDIGCFDGFTSLMFAERYPNYRAITAFEPDYNNFINCEKNLSQLSQTECLNIGLGDTEGEAFIEVAGSASAISDSGNGQKITVKRLDDLELDRPNFIKMDVEGFEDKILAGAENIIKETHPVLAIAAYHSPNQLWEIARQVLNIRQDYTVKIRHYTEIVYETILFFLPKKEAL